MMLSWFRRLVLGSLLIWLTPAATLAQELDATPTSEVPPPPEVSQPAYDVLRVDDNGIGRAYRVWEEWVPEVVTPPECAAWAFFTAQIRSPDGDTNRRLFASHFDPELRVWLPARAMGS